MDAGRRLWMVISSLNGKTILLASNSPRRRELLTGLDIPYSVVKLEEVDESFPPHLSKEEIPVYIAQAKAKAYKHLLKENNLLITADTIVWLDGQVYGKPTTAEEAQVMLRLLSGNTHEVLTGVCILDQNKEVAFCASSKVKFARLDEDEIAYYLERYKPYDKAGSYGVQEWIGYIGVEHIEGSFYNVMGLPVRRVYQVLKEW